MNRTTVTYKTIKLQGAGGPARRWISGRVLWELLVDVTELTSCEDWHGCLLMTWAFALDSNLLCAFHVAHNGWVTFFTFFEGSDLWTGSIFGWLLTAESAMQYRKNLLKLMSITLEQTRFSKQILVSMDMYGSSRSLEMVGKTDVSPYTLSVGTLISKIA